MVMISIHCQATSSVGEKVHRSTQCCQPDFMLIVLDFWTDSVIQSTIRNDLKGVTVMTIAHRLRTVMDFDRIVGAFSWIENFWNDFLDGPGRRSNGAVYLATLIPQGSDRQIWQVEFDTPLALLQKEDGLLHALVNESADKDLLYAIGEGVYGSTALEGDVVWELRHCVNHFKCYRSQSFQNFPCRKALLTCNVLRPLAPLTDWRSSNFFLAYRFASASSTSSSTRVRLRWALVRLSLLAVPNGVLEGNIVPIYNLLELRTHKRRNYTHSKIFWEPLDTLTLAFIFTVKSLRVELVP